MINPFDDRFVIAGQGTIGLEILEDLPSVDTMIAPVPGRGLIDIKTGVRGGYRQGSQYGKDYRRP